MPIDVQLDRLARKIERQHGAGGELFLAFQRPIQQRLNQFPIVEELTPELCIHQNPAPAVEPVPVVIHLNRGCRQFAAVFGAPRERVKPCIQ